MNHRLLLLFVLVVAAWAGSLRPARAQSYPRVWSQVFPAHHPPQEDSYAMAYDEARGVTFLFGGYDAITDGIYAGTWAWDGQDWSLVTLSGPGPRFAPTMVYDSRRQVCVLFGGEPAGEDAVAETWEWDGANWTLRATNGPPASEDHAMAYDASRGRVVMFGGTPCGLCGALPGDTYEWDGNQWLRVATSGPGRRFGAAMAYDERRRQIVLFGGWDPGTEHLFNDTWTWDGTAWTLQATGGPGGTYAHALAYDGRRGTMVLFGGFGENSDQTWEWDGVSWSRQFLFPSPPARAEHRMVYDSSRDEFVVYGGLAEGSPHDTWRLHLAETWVDFNYVGSPIFPEVGSFDFPFNTLAEGVNAAQPGTIVQIKSGSRNESIHIGKPLFLRAYGGPVTVGRQ